MLALGAPQSVNVASERAMVTKKGVWSVSADWGDFPKELRR